MKYPSAAKVTNRSNTMELFRQLVFREIVVSVRGSLIGFLWLILNPMLNMGLYVIVFGVLFQGNFGREENESSIVYGVGVYIGLTIVNLINETIGKSTFYLHQNSNLIKRVAFPLNLLPIIQTSSVTFALLINCVLWLTFSFILGTGWFSGLIWLGVIMLPAVILALGLSALISALSVYLRDIQQLVTFITQIVFWSSGVFFSVANVREYPLLWSFLKWNPILLTIENIRNVVIWQQLPHWNQVLYTYLFAGCFLILGYFLFNRLKGGFSDFL